LAVSGARLMPRRRCGPTSASPPWYSSASEGLRPTTAGGRYAVEEVIRAQFGPALRAFGACAAGATNWNTRATQEEAAEALTTAAELIDAAAKLVPNLGFF
jgi:hypothetical protein